MAILEALTVATKEIPNAKRIPIIVFCDSQKALTAIQHAPSQGENQHLRDLIYDKARELQEKGHSLEIRWIPAHSDLIGNDKAHLAAKSRAERGGKQVENWSSLAYIKENLRKIHSKELTGWHAVKNQEREASRHRYYIPWTKNSINPILGSTSKKYASRYYQLKVGHGAVGTYLVRIGAIETPQCWWCREPVQTVEHLYAKCRIWRRERRKLIRELEKDGVTWQAQAERRWMAGLPANEKAVAPLIRFLKATEIGAREGARGREAEWERKNDRAGEDLLG